MSEQQIIHLAHPADGLPMCATDDLIVTVTTDEHEATCAACLDCD